MAMTKQDFFAKLASLYAVANRADSDLNKQEDWTNQDMAGGSFCRHIDAAIRDMVKIGVLTEEEGQNWYEGL